MGKFKETLNKSLQLFDDELQTTTLPTKKSQQKSKDGVQQVFLQQSVTILAFKDRFKNETSVPDALKPKLFLGLFDEDLPLFIGAIIGASLIIGLCLCILTFWKCCRMTVLSKKKDYCLQPLNKSKSKRIPTIVQSNSVVFLGLKRTPMYEQNKKEPTEEVNSGFFSSPKLEEQRKLQSQVLNIIMAEECAGIESLEPNTTVVEEPKRLIDNMEKGTNQPCSVIFNSLEKNNSNQKVSKSNILSPSNINIPSVTVHHDSEALLHRSCYSGIFDQQSLYSCQSHLGSEVDLKSCSLNWSNYSLRPSSASDCYFDLFQKASFCKKRKNRMRSDIAAAIALNRSRSSQLNKDTDSLVENEVEVILNERTTL